jgi:hypothetical protein
MHRRTLLALTAATALFGFASAQAAAGQLTAPEIEQLLAGNTIKGVWAGSNYMEYFSPSGEAIYVPAGGTPSKGKWRANPDTNEYESWWRSTGWTPYVIVKTTDGGYAFVNGDALEPFTVLPGKQIGN